MIENAIVSYELIFSNNIGCLFSFVISSDDNVTSVGIDEVVQDVARILISTVKPGVRLKWILTTVGKKFSVNILECCLVNQTLGTVLQQTYIAFSLKNM